MWMWRRQSRRALQEEIEMPTISGTRTITTWGSEQYKYLFPIEGTLTIYKTSDEPELQVYTLEWQDQIKRQHSISFVHPGQPNGNLVAQTILEGFLCTVDLTVDTSTPTTLKGSIFLGAPGIPCDGPIGTFTAETNTIPEERPAHRSSPSWRRWLRRLVRRLDESLAEERIAA
jgi:hypothetical protein